jgi:hypothetical protein
MAEQTRGILKLDEINALHIQRVMKLANLLADRVVKSSSKAQKDEDTKNEI